MKQIDKPILREEQAISPGPGRQLRTAREAANVSLAFIAQRLRLKEHVLAAIEADDYKATPNPVFVRGYLRAYARLLNVPADEIVRLFNQLKVPQRRRHVSSRDFHEHQVTIKDWRMKGVTLGLFLSLAILVGLWWQSHAAVQTVETAAVEVIDSMLTDEANDFVVSNELDLTEPSKS